MSCGGQASQPRAADDAGPARHQRGGKPCAAEEYLSLVDTEQGGERTAVAFFGVVLFLMSLMLIVLAKYAEREGLFGGDVGEERLENRRVTYQLAPSLIFYAVATALGLVQPYVGLTLYVLIGVYLIIPTRTVGRWFRRGGKADQSPPPA